MGMFGFLKNPFEKLSADNQKQMVDELKFLNEEVMLGADGVLGHLGRIDMNTRLMFQELVTMNATLVKNGNAGGAANAINQKEADKMGESSIALGGGMEKIVTAIKLYSKIPEKTIDLFIAGMEKLGTAFKDIGEGMKAIEQAGKALLAMAKGIVYFGLALLLSGPIYLLALPLAPIVIGIVIGVLWLFTKFLGDKESMEGIEAGGKALMWMAGGILLFGIALLLAGPIYQAAMSWSLLLVVGVIVAAFILMSLLDGFSDTITDGIKALMWMGLAIVVFGLLLVIAAPIYEYLWNEQKEGMLIAGLVILAAIGLLYLVSLAKDNVYEGAKGLFVMALAIIVLAVGLWMFSKLFPSTAENWATMALMEVAVLGLVASLLIVSYAGDNVVKGAAALLIATAAVIVLGVGLMVWMKAEVTLPQLVMLAAAVAGLTLVLTILGGVGIMVIAGAGALIMAAGAVTLLAYGMQVWMNAKVTTKDAVVITAMIVALGLVATVLGNPFTSWMALIGAGVMIMVGLALVEMSIAMKNFKDAGATVKSAKTIEKIVGVLAGSFAKVTSEGGKDWDWWDVRNGIFAMQNLGVTLTGMAEGVQAFANLTFSEYEYDEKSGKMVEKRRVKLGKADFIRVGDGIAKIISSVSGPLAAVGIADAGGGGPWGSMFGGGGFVRKGIKALAGVGGVLTGLAEGVQAFANLQFTTYVVKDNADGIPTIYPDKVVTMDDSIILTATDNIAKVITTIAKPFGKIGQGSWSKLFAGKNSFPYSGDDIKAGVEALAGVGGVLTGLAEGLQAFANLQFTSYKVQDIEGIPTIVPEKVVTMNDSAIRKASNNIAKVITTIARPFGKIGQGAWDSLFSGNDFPYSSDDIKGGVESLAGIGEVLSGLAKGIQGFARLEFTTMKVGKDKNGVATLVPGEVFKMSFKDIKVAGWRIGQVLSASARAIGSFGNTWINNKANYKKLNGGISLSGRLNSSVARIAKSFIKLQKGLSKIKSIEKFGTNISNLIQGLISPFDSSMHPDAKGAAWRFGVFTKDVKRLAYHAEELESIDGSFENIAKSMGTFKDNINALDLTLIKETRGLFEAMAIIADAGTADEIMAKYGATLKDTFENLATLLEEFGGKVADGADRQADAAEEGTDAIKGMSKDLKKQQKGNQAKSPTQAAQSGNMGAQLDDIANILRGTLKVKKAPF